mgnify:CR=1 FL=1
MKRREIVGRLLVTWLSLLVVSLSLHLSALALVAATEDRCADESGCCSDCPIERSGQECPSDCPNCHCHHAGGAVVVPESEGRDLLVPSRVQGSDRQLPREATAPRAPPLPSLFRPPRALSLLT